MKSVVLCFPETSRVAALALLASALLFACAEQGASAPNSSGQPADAQPDAPPADTDASLDNDDVISTVPGPNDCTGAGTDAATARCLQPTQTPEYYI
jgi:hypothetical protein